MSENFATDPSNAFNLNGNAADETEGTDLASTGTTRYSVRLKNLEGGKKKCTSSCSLNNERSVSTMPLLEETPKKKKHVSQEDKKAIEVLKLESHGVSENTATNPSNVSNLKRNAAGGTKGTNVSPIDFTRFDRLKNLKGCDKKSFSSYEKKC